MTSKFKTKDVSKAQYTNYLKRSGECYNAALRSMQEQEWNAAAINTIHSCIAACDAMCVYFLGRRHSGENHNDAAALFKTIKITEEFGTNANRIVRILRMKNMAEYEDRLVYKSEAEKIFKDCERFLEFVNNNLPKR
ncbi:MAG: HEPN domain-containing protein [Candidatus Omnitrophica bacterium]|nr:HEPN domain-containing protein [Candidatus Omnitrophota bacterium]